MGGLGVKIQHFPLTLLVVLTTLTLPCERDLGARPLAYALHGTATQAEHVCVGLPAAPIGPSLDLLHSLSDDQITSCLAWINSRSSSRIDVGTNS